MTLDEAIEHAELCAKEACGECAEEHEQLAEWLRELKKLKAQNKWLRKEYTSLRKSREREFAKSCEAATNSMGQIGTLRDKNAKLRELILDMLVDEERGHNDDDTYYEHVRLAKELGIEVNDEF